MSEPIARSEYLVLSRGEWDQDLPRELVQAKIDEFYAWLDRLIAEGRAKTGQRLFGAGKTVSRRGVIDGPFGEAKEVVGGYWVFLAGSLEEAAELAATNPSLPYGLAFEIRPIDHDPCGAAKVLHRGPAE